MFLFDTDTLSQVLKPILSPQLLSRMAELPSNQQFTTAITVGEMVYGACHAHNVYHKASPTESTCLLDHYSMVDPRRS